MIASLILLVGTVLTGADFLTTILRDDQYSLYKECVRFAVWGTMFALHLGLFLWFTSEKNAHK